MTENDVIVVRNLTKKFGDLVAVNNISFNVKREEIFGFLGPNGAGKTTTINMLTTLIKPTSGEAYVEGYDVVKESNFVRQVIGLVPQEITVDDDLTGWENIMLQATLYHIPKDEARRRAKEVLELVGLLNDADRMVETYSGGMRKRLEIACGLIHRPKILFLDEPTLGLDVQTRVAIWDYIKSLRREYNMTIFLTTHYMEEADALCDRIAIIDRGVIKAIDSPDNLKRSLGGDIIELEFANNIQLANSIISHLDFVIDHKILENKLRVKVTDGDKQLPIILERLIRSNVKVAKIVLKRPTLDDVFIELTGREFREEEGGREEIFKRRAILRRVRKV